MRHVDLTQPLHQAHLVVRALCAALAQAEAGTSSLQRTLADEARDGAGRAYTVEVVVRLIAHQGGE